VTADAPVTVYEYGPNTGDASVKETKLINDHAQGRYEMESDEHADLTKWAGGFNSVRRNLKKKARKAATNVREQERNDAAACCRYASRVCHGRVQQMSSRCHERRSMDARLTPKN
jgi:hypothetical protein